MEVRQVFAQEENTHFLFSVKFPLQCYPDSVGLLRRYLLFLYVLDCQGIHDKYRKFLCFFGLARKFWPWHVYVSCGCAVVQDRLRITESIISPNNKSVITFTFTLGCGWCIICKKVAHVSEQSRTDHSSIKTSYLFFVNVMVVWFSHQVSVAFVGCWMMQCAVPLSLQCSANFGAFPNHFLRLCVKRNQSNHHLKTSAKQSVPVVDLIFCGMESWKKNFLTL